MGNLRMDRLSDIAGNRYALAYAAAVVLHLLFFLLYVPIKGFLVDENSLQAQVETEPMFFEFVDIPKDSPSESPPEKTPLVAERSSVSRDQQDSELPESHLPFSEGMVASKEDMQTLMGQEGDSGMDGREPEPTESRAQTEQKTPAFRNFDTATDFASVIRDGQNAVKRQDAIFGTPTVPTSLQLNNRESRALERGGLQLSTYDWEFAPYLAYLKEHIGNHINPPAAFTQYGLIDGQTRVRFKIMRDGTMRDLLVLGYKGSRELRDTSTRAVEYSADFRPLPTHFPEEFLEITAFFDYVLRRRTP
jgi:outer membrane biosynthesis protein TonB